MSLKPGKFQLSVAQNRGAPQKPLERTQNWIKLGGKVNRYDAPGTLFYMDPPYFGCETDYGKDVFSRSDFERIAARMADIKGRFMTSLNDTPEVRSIFSAFKICDVALTYTIGSGQAKPVGEVIIMDRKLPTVPNMPE
ncbi:DNA adenine methylase [Brucella anthropi]|uniref:DNA adenine methylase n=1 Tax=Brucella anthropi TaxID=529 RepID=UPI003EDEC10F